MATKDARGNLHDESNGQFTNKQGGYQESVNNRIQWAKENGVEIPLNADGSVDDLKLQEIAKQKPEPAYGFADKGRKNTKDHRAHAKEMGFKNQDEYERAACDFFNSNKGELYYSERRNRFYRYDVKSGWLVTSSKGIVHTFMPISSKKMKDKMKEDKLWKILR